MKEQSAPKVKTPFSLRPFSGRPTTSIPREQKEEHSMNSSSSLKNITESDYSEKSSRTVSSREKLDFLNNVVTPKQKKNFENLIAEEADRIDLINKQKKNLPNITLLEKNIEGLYDWKTLFNHSRPLSSYTKLSNTVSKTQKENESSSFSFPVALIDASEEKVELFIPSQKKSKDEIPKKNKKKLKSETINAREKGETKSKHSFSRKISSLSSRSRSSNKENHIQLNNANCTRPKSMYSKRKEGETFYFSKAFSDYYNESLSDFAKKFPLVKAKITSDNRKLKRAIKNGEYQAKIRERKLEEMKEGRGNDLVFDKRSLILADRGGNPIPLLKSIYKQMYKNPEEIKSQIKLNKDQDSKGKDNTNPPIIANNDDESNLVNYKEAKELKRESEKVLYNPLHVDLHFDTYDERDPQLQIFNQIKEEDEKDVEERSNSTIIIEKKNEIANIFTNQENSQQTTFQNIKGIQIETSSSKGKNIRPRPVTALPSRSTPQILNKRPITSKQTSNSISNEVTIPYNNISSYCQSNNNTYIFDLQPKNIFPQRNESVPNQYYKKMQKRMLEKMEMQRPMIEMTNEEISNNLKNNIFSRKVVLDIKDKVNKKRPNTAYVNKQMQNNLTNLNGDYSKMKWTKEQMKPKEKVNYIYFNNYIDRIFDANVTKREREQPYYFPINFFNKSQRHFYSSSNNSIVQRKRSEEMEFINTNNVFTKKTLRNINDEIKRNRVKSAKTSF